MFSTEAVRAGDVYDDTFHVQARAVLEPLREKLIASGRTASAVEEHSHYGVAFTVDDPRSGGRVYVLLQGGWLLTLQRQLTIVDRFRGRTAEEVDEALVSAIDEALAGLGASPRYWCTRQEYGLMERARGPAFRARGARRPKGISLHVYSADPPLQRDLIQSACSDARLPGDLHWQVAFWPDEGASQRVFGWPPQSPDAARARAAIEANDQAALDELHSRGCVAALALRVMTKEDAAWSATIEHLVAEAPARFRADVAKLVTRYSLETSATRNDLSLTFQCELWRVIGVLANGLMEDPQLQDPQAVRFFSAHDDD